MTYTVAPLRFSDAMPGGASGSPQRILRSFLVLFSKKNRLLRRVAGLLLEEPVLRPRQTEVIP